MKILVMGTGGIGGYFGGRLAAVGQAVTFVARGAHLEAIRRDGLQVLSPKGNITVKPAKAVSDPAAAEPPEIIIFATKLGDTEQAVESIEACRARKSDHYIASERQVGFFCTGAACLGCLAGGVMAYILGRISRVKALSARKRQLWGRYAIHHFNAERPRCVMLHSRRPQQR